MNKIVSVFFNGVSFRVSNWQPVCIGLDSGLATHREQTIMRNYDGIVYWVIYATLGLNVVPGRGGCNLKLVIFKLTSRVDILSISREIALMWMPQDFTDDKSTLVQAMAWCHQATSHYLGQCWPRSIYIAPYGVARPQWVKESNWNVAIRRSHEMHHILLSHRILCQYAFNVLYQRPKLKSAPTANSRNTLHISHMRASYDVFSGLFGEKKNHFLSRVYCISICIAFSTYI